VLWAFLLHGFFVDSLVFLSLKLKKPGNLHDFAVL